MNLLSRLICDIITLINRLQMSKFNQLIKHKWFWPIAIVLAVVIAVSLLLIFNSRSTDDMTTQPQPVAPVDDDTSQPTKPTPSDDEDEEPVDDPDDPQAPDDPNDDDPETPVQLNRRDDWQYEPADDFFESSSITTQSTTTSISTPVPSPVADASTSTIGFSTGGAKDIDTFRRNIENEYLPLPDSITHEGLFYDYFFDTSASGNCQQLFCPAYSKAVSNDPLSKQAEYFMSIGLNSNVSVEDFQRKKLNLVIVLDISGSMSSSMNSYYYDNPLSIPSEEDSNLSKMAAANQSLVALTRHLNDDDRLGVVLFDDQSYVAKPLNLVSETDLEAIRNHILEITPQGGTNMEAGYRKAVELLSPYTQADSSVYENRIIFLTDAMPNTGLVDQADLTDLTESAADDNIYSTFIGIGLDFNPELVQAITQVVGANYYSVHSVADFKRRLDEGFDYMVTPLVFDLAMQFISDDYRIKAVYGSPQADQATGTLMQIKTLFPSLTVDGRTKGGLVLLHLEKTTDAEDAQIELTVSYANRQNRTQSNRVEVSFDRITEHYENTAIRKGIVLSRLANLYQAWLYDERKTNSSLPPQIVLTPEAHSIPIVIPKIKLGRWEQTSQAIVPNSEYATAFNKILEYIQAEIPNLNDEDLQQEIKLLQNVISQLEETSE